MTPSETATDAGETADYAGERKRLTLFAAPKAFDGHTAIIQRNAIASWNALSEFIDIFLMGDEPGIAEIAREFSIRHFPDIRRNESGTPLLDSIFKLALENATTEYLMYVNSDIILDLSLIRALDRLEGLNLDRFLGIGQRIDFDQKELIDFSSETGLEQLNERIQKKGSYASILCKDYFLFPAASFDSIPAFTIGRGNWDNWMVNQMVQKRSPVIDLTRVLNAVHQNHDYVHAGGRMKAYITGPEAQKNKELAGGTNYVSGSVATHRLMEDGRLLFANRFPLLSFLGDFPRIARLVVKLFRQ